MNNEQRGQSEMATRKAVFEIGKYTVKEGPTGGWSVSVTGAALPRSTHPDRAGAIAAAEFYGEFSADPPLENETQPVSVSYHVRQAQEAQEMQAALKQQKAEIERLRASNSDVLAELKKTIDAGGRVTNMLYHARGWVGRDNQGEQIQDAINDIMKCGETARAAIAKAEGH